MALSISPPCPLYNLLLQRLADDPAATEFVARVLDRDPGVPSCREMAFFVAAYDPGEVVPGVSCPPADVAARVLSVQRAFPRGACDFYARDPSAGLRKNYLHTPRGDFVVTPPKLRGLLWASGVGLPRVLAECQPHFLAAKKHAGTPATHRVKKIVQGAKRRRIMPAPPPPTPPPLAFSPYLLP
mgnify:CR=1 FL=1